MPLLMTTLRSLTLLALATWLVSCTYPNHYQNAPADTPHAVLVEAGVSLTDINGQPTPPYRLPGPFRVPAGPTTVKAIAGQLNVFEYPLLRFTAEAGQTYRVQRVHTPYFDKVTVRDSAQQALAEVDREQIR